MAWSRTVVGRPLSPSISFITLAEFSKRSSSFFCAKRGKAIAKLSPRIVSLVFIDLTFLLGQRIIRPKAQRGVTAWRRPPRGFTVADEMARRQARRPGLAVRFQFCEVFHFAQIVGPLF